MNDSNFPINRVVAFAGPYLAVLSGALADWLLVHVNFLGIFHTSKTALSGAITQVAVFGLTALLVWAGHQKWLTGWQAWERTASTADGPEEPVPTGGYDPSTEPDRPGTV